MQDPKEIKSIIKDIRDLIAEYPNSAIPIGAIVSLLFLATSASTLIDGFSWSYEKWGWLGLWLLIGVIVVISATLIIIIRQMIKPRPVIEDIPSPLLSSCPTVKWDYEGPHRNQAQYRVVIHSLENGDVKNLMVPRRMKYKELRRGPYGPLSIKVAAVVDNKAERFSAPINVDIYKDSMQRIAQTGILRVAVHADPGEDIFCFHDEGAWGGFDINLCKMIASHLETLPNFTEVSKKIEVRPYFYKWPEVISSPNDHEVDFAIASISISDERRKKNNILFSTPYTASGLGAVFHEQSYSFNSDKDVDLTELLDKTIIVHRDTTGSKLLEAAESDEHYAGKLEIIVANSNAEVMELHANGSGGVIIYDYIRSFSLLGPGIVARKLTHNMENSVDQYGLTFAPVNTSLQEEINRFLTDNYDIIQAQLDKLIQRKQSAAK